MLGYADSGDSGAASLQTVVICVGIIVAVGIVAMVPIILARSRRHRRADVIVAAAVLWGLLAAGSAVTTTLAQVQWSGEKLQNIESGYLDPRDNSGAPGWPVRTWVALGVGYVGLAAWASRRP